MTNSNASLIHMVTLLSVLNSIFAGFTNQKLQFALGISIKQNSKPQTKTRKLTEPLESEIY